MLDGMAQRIVVIGNSGGGKSVLARAIAAARGLPLVELDRLLWAADWVPVEPAAYDASHRQAIAASDWVIDGLGRRESIAARLARATWIVLVDMPLEVHLRLASQRHRAWEAGTLRHPPGGIAAAPPLAALLRTMHEVERDWMPEIRRLAEAAVARGVPLLRIASLAELEAAAAGAALTQAAARFAASP